MFQYGYVAAWRVYNSDYLAKKGHDYIPTKSSVACVTPMPLKIYWAYVNTPLDEGPVNVQHYIDRYCIFSNSYLGHLKGDQSVCIAPQDFSPCCLLVLLEGKRADLGSTCSSSSTLPSVLLNKQTEGRQNCATRNSLKWTNFCRLRIHFV